MDKLKRAGFVFVAALLWVGLTAQGGQFPGLLPWNLNYSGQGPAVAVNNPGPGGGMTIDSAGGYGEIITNTTPGGTGLVVYTSHGKSANAAVFQSTDGESMVTTSHFNTGAVVRSDLATGLKVSGGALGIDCTGGLKADTVSTGELSINNGADIAERYHVYGVIPPRPGMVVSIDPVHAGRMRITDRAYDRNVAGVISGANGIHPGLVLGQVGSIAEGNVPVTSIGRVWVWCDTAGAGAIGPGDELTTSRVPGCAMRVGDKMHARAFGATLGKAMSALTSGRGLVLVLVAVH